MIYIVDDDDFICRAMLRVLKTVDLTGRAFNSAEDFLQNVDPQASDCLILDIQLPGMSGLELHRHLKGQGIRCPVIIVTAFDDDQLKEYANNRGIVAYFAKPVDSQDLLDTVLSVIPCTDNVNHPKL